MLDAVVAGAGADGLEAVAIRVVPALEASADDVAAADGYVLGTPANLGYMSGALKHFFDVVYDPSLEVTAGRPYGLYLHGRTDTDGARLAVERVVRGLGWRLAHEPVSSIGSVGQETTDACWELGATIAAGLTMA